MGADEFEELRPLLFSIAYRILGSVSEAEDAVQETWLRYHASDTVPISLKSFLAAVVTRVSIDVLRSARVRRETYVGHWLPEPLLTDGDSTAYPDPEHAVELADSLSMAALLLLERLTPGAARGLRAARRLRVPVRGDRRRRRQVRGRLPPARARGRAS